MITQLTRARRHKVLTVNPGPSSLLRSVSKPDQASATVNSALPPRAAGTPGEARWDHFLWALCTHGPSRAFPSSWRQDSQQQSCIEGLDQADDSCRGQMLERGHQDSEAFLRQESCVPSPGRTRQSGAGTFRPVTRAAGCPCPQRVLKEAQRCRLTEAGLREKQ